MKKLVNTVVGTAMVASLVAGCSTNEPAAAPAHEETIIPVETTMATEFAESVTTGGAIEDTTDVPTDTTTIPEETTAPEEETTSFTAPEVTVTTLPEEKESTSPIILPCPNEVCPNATDWG